MSADHLVSSYIASAYMVIVQLPCRRLNRNHILFFEINYAIPIDIV